MRVAVYVPLKSVFSHRSFSQLHAYSLQVNLPSMKDVTLVPHNIRLRQYLSHFCGVLTRTFITHEYSGIWQRAFLRIQAYYPFFCNFSVLSK